MKEDRPYVDWEVTDIEPLLSLYTVQELKRGFYDWGHYLLMNHGEWVLQDVPQAERTINSIIDNPKKAINKNTILRIASFPFMSQRLFEVATDRLSTDAMKVLCYLAKYGRANVSLLHWQLGITTGKATSQYGYRYYGDEWEVLPEFKLLPYRLTKGFYGSFMAQEPMFSLPDDLCKIIMRLLKGSTKLSVYDTEEIEARESVQFFFGESWIQRELPGVMIALQEKPLRLTKKGKPNAASVRSLGKRLQLQEFYPDAKSESLSQLRLKSLISLLILRKKDASGALHEQIKALFRQRYPAQYFTALQLFSYIKGTQRLSLGQHRGDLEMILPRELEELADIEEWIDYASFEDRIVIEGSEPWMVEESSVRYERLHLELASVEPFHDYPYEVEMAVNNNLYIAYLQLPGIRASMFLYAAWGLIDLCYREVDTSDIGRTCLSPFDGVVAFRFTALGRYVLGDAQEYEADVESPFELALSEDVLSIRLTDGDMELAARAMSSFVLPVGNRRFVTNADLFLDGCKTVADLQQKIDLFSSLFPGELPPNWQRFFQELKRKSNPLQEEVFAVFKIDPDNKQLFQLLARDEKISQLIHKAEGYRILVEPRDVAKLRKALRAHGYLVE